MIAYPAQESPETEIVMTANPTPPHQRIAERIARVGSSRGLFAHSILIHGPIGAGHREVAIRYAQSVFCENGNGPFGACGVCRNCRRIPLGEHPDLVWVEPQKEDNTFPNAFLPDAALNRAALESHKSRKGIPYISKKTIEAIQDRLILEPFEGRKVIGCLYAADKMQVEAANSLLKLVEEPPPHALFILVTERRHKILPTIRSRCIGIPLLLPAETDLAESLHHEGGIPPDKADLAARRLIYDGITLEDFMNDSSSAIRRWGQEALGKAILEGEHAFMPDITALKYDREDCARIPQYWRDMLRNCFMAAEGGSFLNADSAEEKHLLEWSKFLSSEDCCALIDQSFDIEEAILGFASAPNALAVFLSKVSQLAEKKRRKL